MKMIKMQGSSWFLVVIIAVMLAVIVLSLRMEYLESKLLPLIISGAVLVLAAIRLGKEIFKGVPDGSEETGEGWRGYLISGAWAVGFFLAIYLLGFIIAIPLFILSYMKSHGTRWLVAIIWTILLPAFIYGLFELTLKVTLYRGLLLPD